MKAFWSRYALINSIGMISKYISIVESSWIKNNKILTLRGIYTTMRCRSFWITTGVTCRYTTSTITTLIITSFLNNNIKNKIIIIKKSTDKGFISGSVIIKPSICILTIRRIFPWGNAGNTRSTIWTRWTYR